MIPSRDLKLTIEEDLTASIRGRCFLTDQEYVISRQDPAMARKYLSLKKKTPQLARTMLTLSVDDLEFLISGISPAGWNRCWPP